MNDKFSKITGKFEFNDLVDLRGRLELLIEHSIPEKFDRKDESVYLYNGNWHMIYVGTVAGDLADLFSLDKCGKELAHICGLIHDVGYFVPEDFLEIIPGNRVGFAGAAGEMKNERVAIKNTFKNPCTFLDCDASTREKFSEITFHVVSEGSELLKKIMFGASLPEIDTETNIKKLILIMALADGLQFAHPGYIYFIPRLAVQSGGTGHFGVPTDYVEILRERTIDNIVSAMETYCPQFVGTDGMTTLLKNQELVHLFLSKCEERNDDECHVLGEKLMSISEDVWPQIKETPSFSDDIPDDFPDRVLEKFEFSK